MTRYPFRRSALLGAALLLATPAAAHAAPAETTETGVLQRAVADTFTVAPDDVRTTVTTTAGGTVEIPGGLARDIAPGASVAVTRRANGTVSAVNARTSIASNATVSGTHHLVIVPVFWQSGTDQTTVPTADAFATTTANVDKYFDTVSAGAIRFTLDRVTAPRKVAVTGCDTKTLESTARGIAGSVPQDQFHHIVVYYPRESSCGFAGLGYVGAGFIWLNGYSTTQVLGHELGHNLGLWHSDGYHCWSDSARQTQVPLSENCQVEGYADPWDLMGSRATGELTAAHLDQLGVLGGGGTQAATAGKATILAPLSGGSGLRQLTYRSGTRTYFLEYRDGGRLDQSLTAAGTGLAVRFTDTGLTSDFVHDHQLISYHPAMPVLQPGEGWNDPAGTISIRTGAATAAGLPVTVGGISDTRSPSAFDLLSPKASASLTTARTTVTWTPVTDDTAVASVTVLVDGVAVATAPGTATSVDAPIPDGRHTLQAVAADAFGNTSRTGTVTVTVDGNAPIGSPAPVATLRAGASVTATSVPVSVAWGLTDPNGVASQRIAQDSGGYAGLGAAVRRIDATAKPGVKVRWQLAVSDKIGHSGTVVGAPTTTTLNTRGGTFTGSWSTVAGKSLLGGSEQSTTAKGAAASYTFTGRAIGLIGTRGPASGPADVYVDGAKFSTINLNNGVTRSLGIVYTLTWTGAGTHTVKVVNQGTRLNVDGFVTLS
ncbi:hypothetical protein [Actinoplanes sp. L3-i22]|uniref:hypothetical protein n=1 Tax=Actinoplanes sp. L3-i22 TaxID=2836373 RepID=UPI001C84A988|nr:hypothetical protein [Actinoplanes sp. L3-i22]